MFSLYQLSSQRPYQHVILFIHNYLSYFGVTKSSFTPSILLLFILQIQNY